MIRKMLVVAAAIAMPVSVVAVGVGTAGAAKGPPTVANDTIHCTTESATVNLNPALTPAGQTSGPAATTTLTSGSSSISGCTVGGPIAEGSGVTGHISGTIIAKKLPSAKHPGSTCVGLLGVSKEGAGSTITVTWSGGLTAIPNSVIALKSVAGGSGSDGHGTFNIAGKPSGSFGGSDKGKSSNLSAETTQTTAQLAAECTPSPGISAVPIENTSAGITLQ